MARVAPPSPWLEGEKPFPIKGGVFVAWKSECHRSSMTSRFFNLTTYFISHFSARALAVKALAYVTQSMETVWVLFRDRPNVVFVLNSPPFLLLSMAVYCVTMCVPFVLDCHTGQYVDRKWAWFLPFYKWFTRRALFNLNHNPRDQKLVESWGGKSFMIAEIPGEVKLEEKARRLPRPNAVFVCSFSGDEPLEELFEAARKLPDVRIYVTGDYRKAREAVFSDIPGNIELTGFLDRQEYLRLIAAADVVVSLVVRTNSMQMAATEAIALGVPIVATDSAVIRESFGGGGEFTDNSPGDIAARIRKVLKDREVYHAGMLEVRGERRRVKKALAKEIEAFWTSYKKA
jgi:glycosyltransferase involved in cell wall biosynthesis